jgi:general secretion pathway protein D
LSRNVVTRVYDIRDLIGPWGAEPPAEFAGAGAAGAPAAPASPASTQHASTQPLSARDEGVKLITQLILDTISPDSWKDKGGAVGSIREMSGQLIVTQTPEDQEELERLLAQLRENRGLQVVVESRFLNVNPQELHGLSNKLRERLIAASGGSAVAEPQQFLSREEIRELLRAAEGSRDSTMLFAPRVTLFNGQRAYVMLGTGLPYVASVSMSKGGADGRSAYEPQMKQLQVGLLFDVQATLTADHRATTVLLQPILSRLERMISEPAPGTPADAQAFVQRPVLTMRQLRTTTTVPDGATLLVGGFQDSTVGGEAIATPATQPVGERAVQELMNSTGGRRLFLLVKPTIIAPREQPGQSTPRN